MSFHNVKPRDTASSGLHPLSLETCVLRKTNRHRGRARSLAPESAPVRHLHYGRILLGEDDPALRFETGDHETGLVCLGGGGAIRVASARIEMAPYDALYVPRGSCIEVSPARDGCDFAEISAPVSGEYPLQFVSFAEARRDASLHFQAGGEASERDLTILLGKNVAAGRILAGVTFSAPGNWTSWPPHEHAAMLEEAYLYISMPAPAWGMQLVYTDPETPELAAVVREGDCVVMPRGFHPNVAAPGSSINFLWMMAAHREGVDRQFGVVNVQPEYAAAGSGLEAARGAKPDAGPVTE